MGHLRLSIWRMAAAGGRALLQLVLIERMKRGVKPKEGDGKRSRRDGRDHGKFAAYATTVGKGSLEKKPKLR